MDLLRDQGEVHIEVRERIEQGRAIGGAFHLFRRLQTSQLLGELLALCTQRGVLTADRVAELLLLIRVEIVGRVVAAEAVGEGADEAGLSLTDRTDGVLQSCPLLVDTVAGVVRGPSGFECGCEMAAPIGAEDPGGEEAGDGGDQDLFADPQGLGVIRKPGLIAMFVGVGLAGVVGDLVAGLAEHAAVADLAVDVRPQDVGALGGRVSVGAVGGAGPLALAAHGGDGVEQLLGDKRLMGGPGRPNPVLRVVVAAALLHRAAVPDLVARVLGIVQDLSHGGSTPAAQGRVRPGRLRRRVGDEIQVQTVGDGVVAELVQPAELEDVGDR